MRAAEADDDLIEVSVAVPRVALERMRELVTASGVTLSAFFSASLDMRMEQHAGCDALLPELEAASRRYMR